MVSQLLGPGCRRRLPTESNAEPLLRKPRMDKRLLMSLVIAFCIPGAIRLLDSVIPFMHLVPRPFGLPPLLVVIPVIGVAYALTLHRWIVGTRTGNGDSSS